MDDRGDSESDFQWEAGFEGDRRIVVARLGPYKHVFPRPKRYTKRFYHRVYELIIGDWFIPLETPRLGPLCTLEASLSVRFQPTLKFAREHFDHIDNLGAHIKSSYETLLRDAAEQEMRALEVSQWLQQQNHTPVERRIENLVHEILAIRDIQSRARCQIETHFSNPENLDEHAATVDSKHTDVVLELMRRRRETAERLTREHYEQQIIEHRIKLEHEERMLNLLRKEAELRRLKQEQETEQVRVELAADETRHLEQIDSEIRLREERIRHEARLRQLELETEVAEKNLRAEAVSDVENHLRREIELLAMERQRLVLEEEIHEARVAKARGWILNAKRRLPSGENQSGTHPRDREISQDSGNPK